MKKTLLFITCFLAAIASNYESTFAQIQLPYQQKLDLQNFPPFWTQTSTFSPRWSISPTANADGTPDEMMATGTTGTGVSRLIVGPINTAGLTSLNLQFNQKIICTDTANFALRIQSSVNGSIWSNEGFALDENSYNCANTINISINNNVGTTTYIAWVITGNHSNFNNWYIDNIIIGEASQADVGVFIVEIQTPRDDSSYGRNGITPRAIVRNFGFLNQNFPVRLTITGGYSSVKMVTNLTSGAMNRITFDGWNPTPGIYVFNVCTELANDQNQLNNCISKEILITNDNYTGFQTSKHIINGWNLVSIPGLHPVNQSIDLWWLNRDQASGVYKFSDGYQAVTFVEPGMGYWMKHLGNQIYNTGDELPQEGIITFPHYPIIVSTGWNLIGGYESPFPTENIFSIPPDIISAPVYGYSGGYGEADTLMPGYGYWVKTSATGLLMIDTSCTNTPPQSLSKTKKQAELFKKEWSKIIITDAAGQNYTLYSVTTKEDLSRYELPPLPPAGVFDIRYSSGKIAEDISSSQSIEMSGVVYPVKIKVENMSAKFTDGHSNEINEELIPGEELIINNSQVNKLFVQSSLSNTPITYSLDQNFPNPFNPSTRISWQSPFSSHQSLKVYDVLGNEVAVLVDEFRSAGRYEANFDASNLASGIYIYKLQTGDFIETKKMILMK